MRAAKMLSSDNQQFDQIFKLVLIGDSGVGKSCLIKQFTEQSFVEQGTTVGVDLHVVDKLVDGVKVRTQIWDTAGQERYSAVTNLYYRNAHGVVLVYDITNHQTFRNIPRRLEEARKHVGPESVIMLVGNKLDLRHLRTVDTGEGRDYADQEAISFIEASAADSTNVINIFDTIIKQMLSVAQRIPTAEEDIIPTVKIKEKKDEKIKKRLQKCCQ